MESENLIEPELRIFESEQYEAFLCTRTISEYLDMEGIELSASSQNLHPEVKLGVESREIVHSSMNSGHLLSIM